MSTLEAIERQKAEFDACADLAKQYRRITMTPTVDDDYPEVRHDYESAVQAFLSACAASGRQTIPDHRPVDMLLFCPNCGEQHIDERTPDWTNPPHRSHLCQFCEHVWRPADVPTNGVAAIETRGQRDGNPRPRYFATAEDFYAAIAAAEQETRHDA